MKQEALPSWNLGDLFKGLEDRNIAVAMKKVEGAAKKFAVANRGKLKRIGASPKEMLRLLKSYEALLTEAAKPIIYAQLLFSDSCAEQKRGAFLQRIKTWHTDIEKELLFFELELSNLGIEKLRKLAKSPELVLYRNFLHQISLQKEHRLKENEEQILSDKNLTGREAFIRLFDQELSQKEFRLLKKGKELKLQEAEVLSMLYDSKRSVRKQGADALTQGLKEEAPRLAFIFNTLIEDKAIEDRLRNFAFPEAARHLANQISKEMVDTMGGVVVKHFPVVQDFYRFKRKILKLDVLYDYDRYAPVSKIEKKISFKEAEDLVLEAFFKFSKSYGEIAVKFFKNKWVDAAKRPGKRGGAFCSFVTPDCHPYVFMNFNGNVRDVFTLAHELGHGIHAYLMKGQGYLNYDVPLTVAETASVFAEMLLFEHLAEEIKSPKELLALYVNKVESIFATVFRQISLFRFEQELHETRRKKGELLVEEINQIWRRSQEEMFGNSVKLSESYDWWWSYIPHFIHTPFYVYAYAYGELLTLSLYARYKKEPGDFVDLYLELLRQGSSKQPSELLAPFKIDMRNKAFWEEGISLIKNLVSKTKSFA
ncbi:MAG: M3 family oligoendopeptidase [SAR324 cluster bacterium]|uniref:M3 family oligoendopeptidase n=1 Tax=SAR324 cluster bacterium TaxID=2024889 RepID=A0A7X9FR21_9DELT|nr:M3 family oligoendopeptidase [SAR324 cluster bacterium]